MHRARDRINLFFAILALLTGCASITTGTSQSIGISTIPEAAECSIYSNGVQIAHISRTPGEVDVHKGATDLVVTCRKDKFLTNSGAIDSKYQGMTWGNILFGGLIGVAVDTSTGSIYQYETRITIQMIPAGFSSVEEKDEFFDGMKLEMLEQAAVVEERIKELCKSKKTCENQLIAAKYDTKKKLSEIHFARLRSRVTDSQD